MHICKTKLLPAVLLFGFLLGSYNGYIALWADDGIEPDRVYPYRVTTLPKADQEALRSGIPVDDIIELTHLLEDYLS